LLFLLFLLNVKRQGDFKLKPIRPYKDPARNIQQIKSPFDTL
jgi:hypothetical protein